jgi:hypothetical protein
MNGQLSNIFRSFAWWSTFTFLVLFLSVHFFLIQLSNMPLSPLKLRLSNVIASYVSPYFLQRWNFFAPQPPERSLFLLARANYTCQDTGKVMTSEWVNVSDSLLSALRKDRATPLFLVEVGLSNALVDYVNKIRDEPTATFEEDGQKYIRPLVPTNIVPRDTEFMTRTALATLEIQYRPCGLESIQLGILTDVYPRFTERNDRDAKSDQSLTLIDWQPAVWVTPY